MMPTVLALMGIESPKGIQGKNLLPYIEAREQTDNPVFSEALSKGPELYSLRTESETFIWNATDETEVTETHNDAMLKKINDIRAANRRSVESIEQRTVKVENEVKDTLKALGYLE